MKLFGIFFIAAMAGWAAAGEAILIRDADVYPVTSAPVKNVSVLIRDGKIAEIGPKIAAAKGVRVVEAKGLRVYPGMIDSGTRAGPVGDLGRAHDGGYRRARASSCRSSARWSRSTRRASTSGWSG